MRNQEIKGCGGFTLVEVLVATAIFSVGILAVATMISKSSVQDVRAYYTSRASMLIEMFFERNARMQYDVDSYEDIGNSTNSTVIDGVEYNSTCIVVDGPVDRCKEMRCIVNWNNKGIQASTQYVYVYSPKY
jgi:prepilin-type N-terminal cleavage/methylation domain-containing protein